MISLPDDEHAVGERQVDAVAGIGDAVAAQLAVVHVPGADAVPGPRAVMYARRNPVVLDDVPAAVSDVNAEVHVVHVVAGDHMSVAGGLDARGLLGHLPAAVADGEAAEDDAVAGDRDHAARASAVDDGAVHGHDGERTADDDRTAVDAPVHGHRAAARRGVQARLQRRRLSERDAGHGHGEGHDERS